VDEEHFALLLAQDSCKDGSPPVLQLVLSDLPGKAKAPPSLLPPRPLALPSTLEKQQDLR
jgi:hypothetical protein